MSAFLHNGFTLLFTVFLVSAIQYSSVTVVDTLTAQQWSLNDPFKKQTLLSSQNG